MVSGKAVSGRARCGASPLGSLTQLLPHPEDRSRFLRFVTGRSRLPARIYIYPDKLG